MAGRWNRRRAVAELYESLAPAVLGYFRSHRMRDPEGLVGDVFVAVTQRIDDFDGDLAAARRWVFTIAHHRRVDEIRRHTRRPLEVDEAPEPVHEDPDPFDQTLIEALDDLTSDQRDVVILRFIADLAIDEVAQVLGRSPGSVKMLQARALTALAAALSDDEAIDLRDEALPPAHPTESAPRDGEQAPVTWSGR